MQYTIEARALTSDYTHRPSHDDEPSHVVIEAPTPGDAISQFVRNNASELVSILQPVRGRESIATVKKDDFVYLVRVYAD